ncbi:carbohydrate kinase family protein [Streptomyces sp. NPDC050095]|uniref:carbohydrate kinase family protein n=1 Tax=unclassified Streptomyces TaxID=2593676 RepID=UPI0034480F0C
MTRLSVVGNISLDRTRYPDHRGSVRLGGAALLVSLASARAGRSTAPVAVVGSDLAALPGSARIPALDWSAVRVGDGPSTSFALDYSSGGQLLGVQAEYGVAVELTGHALAHIARHPADAFHVCCRRPLDLPAILGALAKAGCRFSVDFFLPSAQQTLAESAPWLSVANIVFVNAAEYALLAETADATALAEVVVTDGPRTARVLCRGEQVATACPTSEVVGEVTGAGDTLAGVYLAARAGGSSPAIALSAGVRAASRHVSAPSLSIPMPRIRPS